jgi:hypothetical protein
MGGFTKRFERDYLFGGFDRERYFSVPQKHLTTAFESAHKNAA